MSGRKAAEVLVFTSTEPPLKPFIVPVSDLTDRQRVTIRTDGSYTRPVDLRLEQVRECVAPAQKDEVNPIMEALLRT
jgi:hypothetical protein